MKNIPFIEDDMFKYVDHEDDLIDLSRLDFPGTIVITNIDYKVKDYNFRVKANKVSAFKKMLNTFIEILYSENYNILKQYKLPLPNTIITNNNEYFIEFRAPKSSQYMDEDAYINQLIGNPNYKISLKDKLNLLYYKYNYNYTYRIVGNSSADLACVLYKYETNDLYTLLYYKKKNELIYRYIPPCSRLRAHIDFDLNHLIPYEVNDPKKAEQLEELEVVEADKLCYINNFLLVFSNLLYKKILNIKKKVNADVVKKGFIDFCLGEDVKDKFKGL